MDKTKYVVVRHPDHYWSQTWVLSSHHTLEAAKRAAGKYHYAMVYEGNEKKGDMWRRTNNDYRSPVWIVEDWKVVPISYEHVSA